MNLSNIKTDLAIYHSVKDVAADIKGRNIAALGAALSVLLALVLPFVQPLGAKYGLVIDAETMGYVHDGLLSVAGLCLARHLQSGPATVAVPGPAGDDPAPAPANPERSVPSAPALTDDPAAGVPLGG